MLVPTRARPGYLDVALDSIMPQAHAAGAEVIVVSDGPDAEIAEVALRHRAAIVTLPVARCLNAARNAGAEAAHGELIVFVDDDVLAPEGWLSALLAGVRAAPDIDVFGGPIRPLLEGGGPRYCGREPAPISALDLGPDDCDTSFVWGANMAIRSRAFDRIGRFDESLSDRGDEEDWIRRYAAVGGRVRYIAAAGLHHRRTAADATLRRMSHAAYALGRAARRNDVRVGAPKTTAAELRVLAGCAWHAVRRRCGYGVVMFAGAAGRVRETLAPAEARPGPVRAPTPAGLSVDDFMSGTSGQVFGIRATTGAQAQDTLADAIAVVSLQGRRLQRDASAGPSRRILALGIERTDVPNLMAGVRAELARSHHQLQLVTMPAGSGGKFENLNSLLAQHPATGHDWLLVVDDDVVLPSGFLDNFVFLAERFDLSLAQPAHRRRSHAAWEVTRRRPFSVVRETGFVEIGPVTAFHARTFDALLPFPELRFGWGLDSHWSAVARAHGWRIGVVDATPVSHGMRLIAASYDRSDAIAEARAFLQDRPYTRAVDAQRTLATHRSW